LAADAARDPELAAIRVAAIGAALRGLLRRGHTEIAAAVGALLEDARWAQHVGAAIRAQQGVDAPGPGAASSSPALSGAISRRPASSREGGALVDLPVTPRGNPAQSPSRDSGAARVETRPVSQLQPGDRALCFAGAYCPDVHEAMQVLADAGAGMRIERCVVNGATCTLDIKGRLPMTFPVGELAYVVVAGAQVAADEMRLELDPDAGQADCEGA
jgi:hypothetical protein